MKLRHYRRMLPTLIGLAMLSISVLAQQPAFLTNGLVAYYPFNGNANDMVGINNGVVDSAVLTTDRFNNENQAYGFDGNSSGVTVQNSQLFNFGGDIDFAISMWAVLNAPTNISPQFFLISKTEGGGSRNKWIFALGGSENYQEHRQLYFQYHNPSTKGYWQGEGKINLVKPNEWHNYFVTKTASVFTIYIDGDEWTKTTNAIPLLDNSAPLTIGRAEGLSINGKIDDVRIYRRALSGIDVKLIYKYEFIGEQVAPPINRAPTLDTLADAKLLQNAASQTVNLTGIGSGSADEVQVLTVTATSDNPGLIPNPAVTYTSPNATGTLAYQPVAGVTGKATITVTVKDDGGVLNGGQDTFSRQFTVESTKTENKAPEVQLVLPIDGTTTTVDSPIMLVAEAKDTDGTISKVAFYKNNDQPIGEVSSSPYQVTVNNLSEGKHTFYAKATDNYGLSAVSTAVSISVLGERRDVAVIKVSSDPSLGILTQYITEVQLSGQQDSLTWKSFERPDVSFEVLSRYRVVIWNDPHPTNKASKTEIALLKRLVQSGITIYSIGPNLATAADGLDASDKTDWRSIVNINPVGKSAEIGQVDLVGEDQHGPILDGLYGDVSAFKTSGIIDGATATALADSSGKSGGYDVYVSFPSVSLPDSVLTRRFSQIVSLAENGDELSIEERRKVFKNAICWLLDCNRCAVINITILHEDTKIEPAVPKIGEQFSLKLQFIQSAECPATGVRVKFEVPNGFTILGATTEQGEVSYVGTEANFSLGKIGVQKAVPVQLKLKSRIGGIVTNKLTFYANGLTSTSVVVFNNEIEYTISGDSVPMILADMDMSGNIRIRVGGQIGATYVIEKSTAITSNGQIQWSALKEFQMVAPEYVYIHVIGASTSSMMFRVRGM